MTDERDRNQEEQSRLSVDSLEDEKGRHYGPSGLSRRKELRSDSDSVVGGLGQLAQHSTAQSVVCGMCGRQKCFMNGRVLCSVFRDPARLFVD